MIGPRTADSLSPSSTIGREAIRTSLTATVVAIAGLGISGAASGQTHSAGVRNGASLNGVDQAQSIDCEGQPAEVSGTGNTIAYVGDCPALTVNGTHNQISITLRPGARVTVAGVENVVRWRVSGKGRPAISSSGVGNRIVRLP